MKYNEKPWLAHYDPGVSATVDIPAISLVDLFDKSVAGSGWDCYCPTRLNS